MSYIGKTPATGNFVKLDAITTSSTNTYNLLKDSVAFTPESANHMIVSLNGVIQAPSTAFSVSGSQITFIPASGTLSSSDSIDFILVLGNVLDIGTPSDDTISTAKLQNTSVTAGKLATDSVETAKIQNDAVTTDKINLISTSSTPSLEAKGTAGQTDGYIQLNCEQNSHGIKLQSPPHSAGQSYKIIFPSGNITAGKFLKVDSVSGSGTTGIGQLSFADAGGGLVLIKEVAASNVASVSFVHGTSDVVFDTTYKAYLFVFSQVLMAGDEEIFLRATISGSAQTSSYQSMQYGSYTTSNSYKDNYTNSFFGSPGDVDSARPMSGYAYFYGAGGTSIYPQAMGQVVNLRSNNDYYFYNFGGYYNSSTSNFDGFTFTNNGGPNITSGNFKLYGLK